MMQVTDQIDMSPPDIAADGMSEWANAPEKSRQWAHTMIPLDAE
jgi:hypothetical protein